MSFLTSHRICRLAVRAPRRTATLMLCWLGAFGRSTKFSPVSRMILPEPALSR
jgi:hypothetical protein